MGKQAKRTEERDLRAQATEIFKAGGSAGAWKSITLPGGEVRSLKADQSAIDTIVGWLEDLMPATV